MAEPEVALGVGESANSGECGSCVFFRRDGERSPWPPHRGRCAFRMPPTRVYEKAEWDPDSLPLDTVDDRQGCDFWRSTGKTYIVSQRLKP